MFIDIGTIKNMSTLREVQMCSFEIMKEVVKICERNSISYYLSCGTLLGAVRHQGFIPWDNDIDLEMPIEDYRKFLKIAKKELPDNLFLQNYKTDPGYNEIWTKIRKNGTTSLPVAWKGLDIHWGIGIDIFPLTEVPSDEKKRKKQARNLQLCRLLIAKDFILSTNPDDIRSNPKLKFIYSIPRFIRISLCEMIEKKVFMSTGKEAFVSIIDAGIVNPMKKAYYKSTKKILFEGELFCVPGDYKAALTAKYGDYMTLPPESERVFGHEGKLGKIIYEVNEDYSNYLN